MSSQFGSVGADRKFCTGCGSELDPSDQSCQMCGKAYVPLRELSQQSDEQVLIPLKGIVSGGAWGGKHYDVTFTNRRIVALAVFIGTWRNSRASGFGPMGADVAYMKKVGAMEEEARQSYSKLTLDEALRKDGENSFQIPYESVQSIRVFGRFIHRLEITYQGGKRTFGLDPVDYSGLLGALPQVVPIEGKLHLEG